MYIVLLISQKDYVLYKIRINIVFARHLVLRIENSVQRWAYRKRNQNCSDLLREWDNVHSPFD